uniref:BolA protein n=1 Tax=Chromera velia CCMP2878 TaxID=1169474 RepID=A0A0G4GTB0_9ALVE|eukprot:Cvel_23310.t1-p1 / transcript=Cvel_23310.t1 / gene=Cvel_23310 / organism=Chromera_velia_CCMP2878 / gene_product=SufE-like protein, chloroplastic, putative / transcript_product=SufE-like protein, chloroplastic, putative / location=Cvel_scaffold2387:15416-17008(+) / protein_length=106 / sequence_SO=supercontig / SO=protein_coding / is_pseudo=false
MGPVQDAMRKKLTEQLKPTKLEIEDESYKHRGHRGVAEDDKFAHGETHFNVEIESEAFSGMPMLKRHQLVYQVLDDEMKNFVHALSIKARPPPAALPLASPEDAAK